jgi:glycosyltransferase involved in cell wall biosynthesis
MVRVVVAHNRYREAQPSGENTVVDQEIEALRGAGVEVIPLLHSSDEIASMPVARRALLPLSPIYAGAAQRELRTLLRAYRPDLVHLHNPYPLLSPWVVRTAHAAGVPVVQTVHNYRQVCSSGLYFRDGQICTDCRGRRLGMPGVLHACYRGSTAQSAVMATALALHRPTWRAVDRYIALTDAIAEHLRGYGIAGDRIAVKPNSAPDPGEPAAGGDGMLYFGRLSAEKGLSLLLDAWREHPEGALGQLRIAGDGPLRELVASAAARRGDLTYLGPLDRPGVRAALAGTALVVVPSTWHDVLPTVVIESLAAGRPVLGTALGGIPYLVGDAGWLVPPTVPELARAMPVALAGADQLRDAARRRYLTTFSPQVVTQSLLDIYAGLLRRA